MRKLGVAAALCLSLVVSLPATALAQGVIYVDADATGDDTGASWTHAYTDLQDALTAATPGDEIWVAEGTYRPATGSDRTISFTLVEGVALYGGFVGTESLRDERDWVTHETILSGDLLGDDDPAYPPGHISRMSSDNSYHVVVGANDATLDGFTVTEGHADHNDHTGGGGMFSEDVVGLVVANNVFVGNWARNGGGMCSRRSSLTVADCAFCGNSAWDGGGMSSSSSFPVVTGCEFLANSALRDGGGVRNYDAWATYTGCTFVGNLAQTGGGMYNYWYVVSYAPSPAAADCVFSGNSASECGGGMCNYRCSAAVTNCVLAGNTAGYGGAMCNQSSSWPDVTNCVFSGNSASFSGGAMRGEYYCFPEVLNSVFHGNRSSDGPDISDGFSSRCTVSFSRIAQAGGFADAGRNTSIDPMFVYPGRWDDNGTPGDTSDDAWIDGDYHLQAGSPCIDRADGDAAPEFDIEGSPRHDDPGMPNRGAGTPDYADTGAYEFQGRSRITPFAGGCHVCRHRGAGYLAGLAFCLLLSCCTLMRPPESSA